MPSDSASPATTIAQPAPVFHGFNSRLDCARNLDVVSMNYRVGFDGRGASDFLGYIDSFLAELPETIMHAAPRVDWTQERFLIGRENSRVIYVSLGLAGDEPESVDRIIQELARFNPDECTFNRTLNMLRIWWD